jgi:hypothetical protein
VLPLVEPVEDVVEDDVELLVVPVVLDVDDAQARVVE